MPHHVRPRGARWELRVKHRLLPRPYYSTFGTQAEAEGYGQQLDAMLDRGVVPAELLAGEPRVADDPLVVAVVRAYLAQAPHLTPSDERLLATMVDELVGVRLSGVTYRWALEWVHRLKTGALTIGGASRARPAGLAPGTIRKRVGALARVIDWHLALHRPADGPAPVNALRLLPSGYSQYTAAEQRALTGQGRRARTDVQRDRRLQPAEEARIRATLAGEHRPDKERPWGPDPAMALLFSVIVDTGLRLREAYTLRVDQVDLARGVLRVEGTKGTRGQIKPRVVPLKRHLRAELQAWCVQRVGLVWPFWSGRPDDLDAATRRLSARFRTLFSYAQVPDITEHDLRHEATCRWFELRDEAGRWVFADVEVARIMGWASLAMALRYASLRGEDLAARL